MALTLGARLGVYEVTAQIGEGGMGQVYRATDTKLKRQVALKILPLALAGDTDRLARFQREAEVLASLNHPHIAALYGLEESGGVTALVMELVEGEDLSQRITRGAIPLDEALPIAKQITEALEAAHERGIVHRDLKPANIKVTPDAVVKVLDFGLAKAMEPTGGSSPNLSMSPTTTTPAMMTGVGVILGTAAYMAPEQARGKAVDKRADIWAFGCVLYEMLTGRRAFEGDDIGETLAAVIKGQPVLDLVPVQMRPLLESCLEKDPRKRLRDIGDAWRLLGTSPQPGPLIPAKKNRWPWAIAAASLSAAAAAVLVVGMPWNKTSTMAKPLMRLDAVVGADVSLGSGEGPTLAISPDGSRLALVTSGSDGKDHLALRLLENPQTTVLAGTNGAASPFFSPDSRWVAFFAGGKLKKISVEGGAPVTLCDARNPRGGSWGEDGNILFASENRVALSRVSAAGGKVTPATELDGKAGEITNRYPQALPGGEAFLFSARSPTGIYTLQVQSIKTGERKILLKDDSYYGRYVSSGYLIFMRQGALYAAPMDIRRLEMTGPAVPVIQDARAFPGNGWAYLDVSQSGTLVYLAAPKSEERSLAWVDSSGTRRPLPLPAGPYSGLRVSPDGSQFALLSTDGPGANLFVYDWAHDRLSRVASFKAGIAALTWSPDGKHLVFDTAQNQLSGPGIYWMRADGAGEPQRLLDGPAWTPFSFSPDGKRLGYWHRDKEYGLWTLPLDLTDPDHPNPGAPERFLESSAEVRGPTFSPDGRWVSYASFESSRLEVYVRPFLSPGGKWQISTGGGGIPKWSSKGHELYYQALNEQFHTVEYHEEGRSFVASQPRAWSAVPLSSSSYAWDMMPDGKRLVVVSAAQPADAQTPTRVTFLVDFFDQLRRIAPAEK